MGELQLQSQIGVLGFSLGGWAKQPELDGESVLSQEGSLKSTRAASDTSSSSDEDEFKSNLDEFLIQCKGDDMVFVTSSQSKTIQLCCPPFKDLIRVQRLQDEGGIVQQPEWPAAVARQLIEILTTGSTWIENDEAKFLELAKTAQGLSIDVRVCCPINFQDPLPRASTHSYFKMISPAKYQFQLRASVASRQWTLLNKLGILLSLHSNVLRVKMEGSKNAQLFGAKQPSPERLKKCDLVCSDFSVYANGKMQSLLTIANVLSQSLTPKEHALRMSQGEELKLVFKTRRGSLPVDSLDMFWRITASSFTFSTAEERSYIDNSSYTAGSGLTTASASSCTALSVHTSPLGQNGSAGSPPVAPKPPTQPEDYEYRTICAPSFKVLMHLFNAINMNDEDLPASLVVKAATPDTLGRMINACCQCVSHELGFDLEENVFYACKASNEMKTMLAYLEDYSSSAVVRGDFKLSQHIH